MVLFPFPRNGFAKIIKIIIRNAAPWQKKNLPCFQVVCYFPIFPKSTESATEQVVPVVKGELL